MPARRRRVNARETQAQTKRAANQVPQLEQALAKNPDDPKINVWRSALAYLERSDFPQAIAALRKAVALEPGNIAAHFNLGMALRETGDLEAALHHLRLVVQADAGNASGTTSSDRRCGRSASSEERSRRSNVRSRSIPSCARVTTRSAPR